MTESFAELFEQSIKQQQMRNGAILKARVMEIRPDVVIVNAGLKSEGVIPAEQFKNESGELEIAVGDDVEVALDAVEDVFGETRLSREKAQSARSWSRL
ncbi:MAG: S1 RNA-binding domain-containing protein, partial [Gammaproteobacteria bacterium]|nr:S1 RNA-binding domain-containing protein [Gammaproteobacteria bacterium]